MLRDSVSKASACSPGDLGSIPGSGSSPGEGNGNPLHYSCLENPMNRGVWQAIIYGIARVGYDLALSPSEFCFLTCAVNLSYFSIHIPMYSRQSCRLPFIPKTFISLQPQILPWTLATSAAAAAAKLLQLCLTLCSPIDGSPPGSNIHGILQARTLGWVAISLSSV